MNEALAITFWTLPRPCFMKKLLRLPYFRKQNKTAPRNPFWVKFVFTHAGRGKWFATGARRDRPGGELAGQSAVLAEPGARAAASPACLQGAHRQAVSSRSREP